MANIKGSNVELINKINNQSLKGEKKMENNHLVAVYETESGIVTLNMDIIKKYLVNGDANKITDQEAVMFLNLCKFNKLNPFQRDAYLIKYGTQPATIVVSKDLYLKRANRSGLCTGYESGIVVMKKDGNIEERKGALVLPGEKLIGGWAKAYRKDFVVPVEAYVTMEEYAKETPSWKKMPATMIRKVALVQALREAFPEEFAGLYVPEEMPQVNEDALPTNNIRLPENELNEESVVDIQYEVVNEAKKATKEQLNDIWNLAQDIGINKTELKQIIYKITGKENGKELTEDEANLIINTLYNKSIIDIDKMIDDDDKEDN